MFDFGSPSVAVDTSLVSGGSGRRRSAIALDMRDLFLDDYEHIPQYNGIMLRICLQEHSTAVVLDIAIISYRCLAGYFCCQQHLSRYKPSHAWTKVANSYKVVRS